jgi:hypothetical protein
VNQAVRDVVLIRSLSVIVAALALCAMWEAFLGHYRSGFAVRMQYAPLLTAAILVGAGVMGAVVPARAGTVLQVAGWIGIVSGLIGVGYHHYYGIIEKAGGYKWLLHHLMYHAPPLAPLLLAALGALALLAGSVANGAARVLGLSVAMGVVAVCAVTILGAAVQSGILHFRGAFNNWLMYVPVTLPLAAVAALVWQALAPSALSTQAAIVASWLIFLSGFVGFGMHLRGIDRQMGGMYIARQNLMQGPPVTAPLTFSGFAAAALVVLYLP